MTNRDPVDLVLGLLMRLAVLAALLTLHGWFWWEVLT